MEEIAINVPEGKICQIGIVVKDLDEAVEKFYRDFGIGPWYFWNFEQPQLTEMYYKGEPMHGYGVKIAIASMGGVQCELIQPLYGKGTHTDFLEKKGEGFHHIKLFFKDIDKAVADFKSKGIEALQSGKYNDDIHVYLDTEKSHGFLIEIGNNSEIGPYFKKYPE